MQQQSGTLMSCTTPGSLLQALLTALFCKHSIGHPSLVVDGRASCGTEYDRHSNAYVIPDIDDSWYARRISTCSSPFFWMHWNVTSDDFRSRLYIAAITPEIERFRDKLKLNGVLFGPGMPVISQTNDGLVETDIWRTMREVGLLESGLSSTSTVDAPEDLPAELRQGLLLDGPTDLDSCTFVDNQVMRKYADVIDGRCMESLKFSSNYKAPLRAGTRQKSWWIYSQELGGIKKKKGGVGFPSGQYYLVTWLSSKDAAHAVSGKYEVTIGPWVWYDYAEEKEIQQARAQGTRCSCAVNAIDYLEQNAARIGFEDDEAAGLWALRLPYETCNKTSNSTSREDLATVENLNQLPQPQCYAEEYLTIPHPENAIEWVGWWRLEGGKRYTWRFRAYRSISVDSYEYPDATMDVFVKEVLPLTQSETGEMSDASSTDKVSSFDASVWVADQAMREGQEFRNVFHGESLDLNSTWKQRVHFNPSADQAGGVVHTTVFLDVPAGDDRVYAVFTQHRTAEFMSQFVLDSESRPLFPVRTRLVGNNPKEPLSTVYQLASTPVQTACSAGCPAYFLADGFCDDPCNVGACNNDNGDCEKACSSLATSGACAQCSGYVWTGASCQATATYTFVSEKKHWTAAEADCVNRGGHLVSIHSEAENDVVMQLCAGYPYCWIGGKKPSVEPGASDGSWSWSDGLVPTFTNFEASNGGHRVNSSNQPYIFLRPSTGQWEFDPGAYDSSYVCEAQNFWTQIGEDNSKCAEGEADALGQYECQENAIAAGHSYYQFSSYPLKCRTSPSCDSPTTGTSWPWKIYQQTPQPTAAPTPAISPQPTAAPTPQQTTAPTVPPKAYAANGIGTCRDSAGLYPSWGWASRTEQSAIAACNAEPTCSGYALTARGIYQFYCSSSNRIGTCNYGGNGGVAIVSGSGQESAESCMVAQMPSPPPSPTPTPSQSLAPSPTLLPTQGWTLTPAPPTASPPIALPTGLAPTLVPTTLSPPTPSPPTLYVLGRNRFAACDQGVEISNRLDCVDALDTLGIPKGGVFDGFPCYINGVGRGHANNKFDQFSSFAFVCKKFDTQPSPAPRLQNTKGKRRRKRRQRKAKKRRRKRKARTM